MKYLARRYYCRLHVFLPISHPTYVVTKQAYTAVLSVAFHPSLHFLTSEFYDRTVRLWNCSVPENTHEVAILTGHTYSVLSVAFHPTELLLASGYIDEKMVL